jgi:iron complex transport system permease protein
MCGRAFHSQMTRSRWLMVLGFLIAAATLGIAVGTIDLSPGEVWDGLRGTGDPMPMLVVRTLRLPRVVLAALVGAALAMSGAALQGTMRNPLAEPYLLGVSGGAAVGAVVATALGFGAALLPIGAFVGAACAVGAAFGVAHVSGARGDPRVLLMAGVVVGAFANAAIMVILANAPPNAVRSAVWWMMGSVADASWMGIAILFAYVLAAGSLLVLLGRQIDVLALGEEAAAGLGLDVDRAIRWVFLTASLLAAATVSAAGLVGFVGLVVPHLVRAMGEHRHRPLLVASALTGASLVVVADVLGRVLRPPAELPLGAVTALIGVPFFLAKLRRLS